jgi:hypothetical protein
MFSHVLSSYLKKINNTKLYFFTLTFSLLIFLSGCEIKSAQLKALENSVSIIQPTTGREVDRYTRNAQAGFTGPIYAQIRIDYEPINNHAKEDVYEEIVAILEKNNWEGKECDGCRTTTFIASLPRDDYPTSIHAIVLIRPDENLVSISMEHPSP